MKADPWQMNNVAYSNNSEVKTVKEFMQVRACRACVVDAYVFLKEPLQFGLSRPRYCSRVCANTNPNANANPNPNPNLTIDRKANPGPNADANAKKCCHALVPSL